MHGGQGELPETAVCELGPHCWVRTAGSRRMDRCWPHGVGRALLAEGAEADCVALCGLRGETSHGAWPAAWGQGRALSQGLLVSEAQVPFAGVLGCRHDEPWLKATETVLSRVWSLDV